MPFLSDVSRILGRWSGYLLTRWFLGSVVLGGCFGLLVNAGLLAASTQSHSVGELVDDGSVVASALTVEVEWLLIAWHAVDDDRRRRAVFAVNGVILLVLSLLFLAIRVDSVLVDDAIFELSYVRSATTYSALLTVLATLLTAVVVAPGQSRS